MRITVLGAGAAYPRAGGACTGYLLEGGGVRVWIDAGNGTLSNLQRHVKPADVDALVLSHVHGDHIADVVPFMYALGFDPAFERTLPVWSPAEVPGVLEHPLGAMSREILARVFAFTTIEGDFEIGGLALTPFRTVHPVETYGFRVADGDATFVFTSDTAAFPGLAGCCADADLLVCEASYTRALGGAPGVHLWAEEAGEVARDAAVRRLVLTHVWPTIAIEDAELEAAGVYRGPIEAAQEGRTYEL